MKYIIYTSLIVIVIALFTYTNVSSQTTGNIPMEARLSPSQARAALNYEPTEGPLQSFFPQCTKEQQESSTLSKALGKAELTYNTEKKELHFKIEFTDLSGPTIMVHFHNGAPGVSGPVLQTICGMPPPASAIGYSADAILGPNCPAKKSGVIKGTYALKDYECPPDTEGKCTPLTVDQQVHLLTCGNLYVNFHTCLNQPGEISGQIIPLVWTGEENNCNSLPPKDNS